MRLRFSWRVGGTRDFDHRRVGDLDSRTEPVIEGAAGPDRLSDQSADRPSLSRERRLQFSRDDDRRAIARDKLKIQARARKSNPPHRAFDHHKSARPAAQLGRIGRLDHGEIGVTPYAESRLARSLFDHKPLGGATAGLEFGPDAGVTG